MFPTSLTSRLIVTTVALVAVISLLVAAVATIVMRAYLINQLDSQVTGALNRGGMVVQGQVRLDTNGQPPGGQTNGPTPPDPRGTRVGSITAVFDTNVGLGTTITASGDLKELTDTQLDALDDLTPNRKPVTLTVSGLGSYRVAAEETPSGRVLVQGIPTKDVDDTIRTLIWWEAGLGMLGVLLAAIAGRILVGRQLEPLRKVATTANEVSAMPLSTGAVGTTVRVPAELTDPTTEVGQVGEALNKLLEHMEHALDARHESEQQARTFLADASHELRTPLSTIKGYAELSRRTGRADPDEILAKVESEAGRMSSLVEDMLLLARLDAGRELERHDVDLTRLVVEAVNDARVVDPKRKWTFDVPDEPIIVSGDEQRLHQAVTNLLTNASRHTPPKTVVTVRMRVEAAEVVIEIHDNGPGIAPDLLPTLFDRFTRGDSSRTRASGGAGLGMSLVEAIMHGHGGTASVTSEPGNTTFALRMPISA
ncbi:two-component system OmpR family sensor kinase [Aeromicrobium panaciterrae]|uniref:histidine kinase n=1 Tax=Aeromicrobium panaciterrae TaxID=363861 RepID=A0ABU1UR17_9ACTN|nr:ATP-binding protein [Aeromicrobium panaciterrae]MDR7087607.1 two-component system OmpR family sensor kinase [Aeromicrobium panaciterrae]